MRRLVSNVLFWTPVRFWTRRCRGCDSPDPHSHHLTWWGHLVVGSKR